MWRRAGPPIVVSPRDETREISDVQSWFEWAGPLRGAVQWADGRSAVVVGEWMDDLHLALSVRLDL
jgi:hypothetical protein